MKEYHRREKKTAKGPSLTLIFLEFLKVGETFEKSHDQSIYKRLQTNS
jgi:hypothetical protein